MFQNRSIGAVAGLITLAMASTAWAQTNQYGVFRENVPTAPINERNCWVQAMVSGQTINAELLTTGTTSQQAQCLLQTYAQGGLCAAQDTAPTWSARAATGAWGGWYNGSASGTGFGTPCSSDGGRHTGHRHGSRGGAGQTTDPAVSQPDTSD